MLFVPYKTVQENISKVGRIDMKSIAYNSFNVLFPELLAAWLDPEQDIDTGNTKIAADQKNSMAGSAMFGYLNQQIIDSFQMAFNIYNIQRKDYQEMAKLF